MSNGKGDTPRPLSVSRDAFDEAYERTFGAKKPKRVLADPATCMHRNRFVTIDTGPCCDDCGAALRETVATFTEIAAAVGAPPGRVVDPGEVFDVYADEHDGECYRCDEDDSGAGGI